MYQTRHNKRLCPLPASLKIVASTVMHDFALAHIYLCLTTLSLDLEFVPLNNFVTLTLVLGPISR